MSADEIKAAVREALLEASASGDMKVTAIPKMYDIHKDEFRPVTQADVDLWSHHMSSYGKLRRAIQAALEANDAAVKQFPEPSVS